MEATTSAVLDLQQARPRESTGRAWRLARYGTAAALAVTSLAHIQVAVEHLNEVPYLGVAFYAFVIVTAAGAGSLLVENRAFVWRSMAVVNFAAIVVFVVSRIFGLPGATDDKGDWANSTAITCLVAQGVVVTVAYAVLRHRSRVRDL